MTTNRTMADSRDNGAGKGVDSEAKMTMATSTHCCDLLAQQRWGGHNNEKEGEPPQQNQWDRTTLKPIMRGQTTTITTWDGHDTT